MVSQKVPEVVIASGPLHRPEPARFGAPHGVQGGAKQSDEVVARAKPVAISRVPSLRSGQGFVATLLAMTCDWTFLILSLFGIVNIISIKRSSFGLYTLNF